MIVRKLSVSFINSLSDQFACWISGNDLRTVRLTTQPILDSFGDPLTSEVRAVDALDSAGRILIRIDDSDFSGACVIVSFGTGFYASLDLVMKAAAKNKLCMQVCGRQRVAEKNQFLWRAERVGAVVPEPPKHRLVKVLEICGRYNKRRVSLSRF